MSDKRLCDALTELVQEYGVDTGLGIIDMHYSEDTHELAVTTAQEDIESGLWFDRTDWLDVMASGDARRKARSYSIGSLQEPELRVVQSHEAEVEAEVEAEIAGQLALLRGL